MPTKRASRYLGTPREAAEFAQRIGGGLSVSDFVVAQFHGSGRAVSSDEKGSWFIASFGGLVRITSDFREVLVIEDLYERQRRQYMTRHVARILEMGSVTGAVTNNTNNQPIFWYNLEVTGKKATVDQKEVAFIENQLKLLGYSVAGSVAGFVDRRQDGSIVFTGLHLLRPPDWDSLPDISVKPLFPW